jgi:hypothetical protein
MRWNLTATHVCINRTSTHEGGSNAAEQQADMTDETAQQTAACSEHAQARAALLCMMLTAGDALSAAVCSAVVSCTESLKASPTG